MKSFKNFKIFFWWENLNQNAVKHDMHLPSKAAPFKNMHGVLDRRYSQASPNQCEQDEAEPLKEQIKVIRWEPESRSDRLVMMKS